MSLTGNATTDKVLRGRINRLDTLCISAYEIAVKHGFSGTEEEWLASLRADKFTEEDMQDIINEVSESITPESLNAAPAEHLDDISNPHKVTAAQVGLGNVDNTSDMNKPVSTSQAEAIADAKKAGTGAQEAVDTHVADTNNPHGVTAKQIGAAPAADLPNTFSRNLTVGTGQSIRFRISWHLFMVGRVMAAANVSSAAVYALTSYNEYRAPIVTELSVGTGITVATGGDNNTGWYIEVTNNGGSTASLFLIGNCIPTII